MERAKFLVSTHLFLIKGNEILLYLRKGGNQDHMYNMIAGHLDGGEDPREATIREAYEEAGIKINKEDLVFENVSYSIAGPGKEYVQFYFSTKKWEGKIQNLELDKCYKMDFFPINNLPQNITPYIQKAINDFINKIKYNEYK